MRRTIQLFLMIAASTALFAADKPNFSGTWKENMEKSTKSSMTSYVNKIEQSADSMKVTTISNGPRGERTSERTYVFNQQFNYKMSDGDEATALAKWYGSAFVLVVRIKEPEGERETKETWTLSEDGKTLTKQRHSHDSKGDRDETHVLEKQ